MKRILLLPLLLSFSSIAFTQVKELPVNSEGDVEFTEVVSAGGLTSNQLYDNAKEWAAKTFYDYKAALQFEDDKNDKLIFKWSSSIPSDNRTDNVVTEFMLDYTIVIECKDEKYRYKINQIKAVTVKKTMDLYTNAELSSTSNSESLSEGYNKIRELEAKKEEYENINSQRPNVKRTMRKVPEYKKEKVNSDLSKQIGLYNLQLKAIDNLIVPLKKAMTKNDDNF